MSQVIPRDIEESPRHLLEREVAQLRALVRTLNADVEFKKQDFKLACDNLTATQTRCTELMLELRRLKRFAVVADAIERGERLHPEGPNLPSLMSEVGELADELLKGEDRRDEVAYRGECLDVAVVALRMFFGGRP